MRLEAPRAITLFSGKGGTGKTTVTANLGASVILQGKRAVLFDGDLGCPSLDIMLKLTPERGRDFKTVLDGKADISDVIFDVNIGGKHPLGVIPAGHAIKDLLAPKPVYSGEKSKRALEAFQELFKITDLILIDAPAGLDAIAQKSIRLGNEAVIVCHPTKTAIADGLKAYKVAEYYETPVRGAILNNVTSEAAISAEAASVILRTPVLAAIPYDEKVMRAEKEHKLVVVDYPKSPFARLIKMAAETIVKGRIPGQLKPFRKPQLDEYLEKIRRTIEES